MNVAAFRLVVELVELPDTWQIQGVSLGPQGEVILRASNISDLALRIQPGKYFEAIRNRQWQYFLVQDGMVRKLNPPRRGYLHVQPFGSGRFLWAESRCSAGEDNAFLHSEGRGSCDVSLGGWH
jgi:hypothetical protein